MEDSLKLYDKHLKNSHLITDKNVKEEISSNAGTPFDGEIHNVKNTKNFSSASATVKISLRSGFRYDDLILQKEDVEVNANGVLIGHDAEDAGQGNQAKNLKREIKMELNSTFVADGKRFSAKEIVGHILNYVKEISLQTAREKMINEPLEGVVISVPAAFTMNEKEFICAAAEIPENRGGPGLNVLDFIKEPVAAALTYFSTPLTNNTKILVYDLGGGTCDVAIVKADSSADEKYTVVDSAMCRIGGKDWDEKLQKYITDELEKNSGVSVRDNPAYTEKIKRAAIKAKEDFSVKRGGSYRDKVQARIEINGRIYSVEITKQTGLIEVTADDNRGHIIRGNKHLNF